MTRLARRRGTPVAACWEDPSIVERISHAYAAQPQIVKTLGKAALAVAMAQMVRKQYAAR